MSEKIIQLNEGIIKEELEDLVRNSVEETLKYNIDWLFPFFISSLFIL